jgi:hypothetical protein
MFGRNKAVPPLQMPVQPERHDVLSRIKLSALLAEQPAGRTVVKLAHDDTIADALSVLAEHNILAAPGARTPPA